VRVGSYSRVCVCGCVCVGSFVCVTMWCVRECVNNKLRPYSSVVEHSLRKRKVGGSIPPGGSTFRSHIFYHWRDILFHACASQQYTHIAPTANESTPKQGFVT
jgi:hypothetical protein